MFAQLFFVALSAKCTIGMVRDFRP